MVVAEWEAAPHGSKAAVLRREGLCQSQIREWRAARDALAKGAAAPWRRHCAAAGGEDGPARLRAENQRLTRELAQSSAVGDIMGKLHRLLEHIFESTDTQSSSRTR